MNHPSNKVLVWVGIVAVVAAVIAYLLVSRKNEAPAEPATGQINQSEDTTAAIQKQLDSIDTGNLDAELKDIDVQLNNL